MASLGKISWPGLSGKNYEYEIYNLDTPFRAIPGNYVFSKQVSPGRYSPIYIGETGDLSQRFDGHHKAPDIKKSGATHIHVHAASTNRDERLREETDLVRKWDPPCNG